MRGKKKSKRRKGENNKKGETGIKGKGGKKVHKEEQEINPDLFFCDDSLNIYKTVPHLIS